MNANEPSHFGRVKRTLSVLMTLALTSGCAASTVLRRPPKKNLAVLNTGNSRGAILAELGSPTHTRSVKGETVDTFAFDKGVSGGYKFGRAFFHIGADLFTIALWEIVGWPAEKLAAKPNTQVEVGYDSDEKVRAVNYLKGP